MERREQSPLPAWRQRLFALDEARNAYLENQTPAMEWELQHRSLRVIEELHRTPGRFELGQLLMTPGADKEMARAGNIPAEYLLRHRMGDWGLVDEEDWYLNDRAIDEGTRLLSSYRTRLESGIWVLTEADRSATTLLRPDAY